jgi:hypothetical protein
METCEYTNALLPERWVLGQLDPAAAAELEEHLMTCGACQEAVESARGLRRGLALAAAESAARATVPIPIRARPARRWLALAALLPLAAVSVLLLRQQGESAALRGEVARLESQNARAAEEARLASAGELEKRQLAEQHSQELARQLEESRQASAGPLVDLPTFLLAVVRDRPSGPDVEIDRSQADKGFHLALDLPDPSYTSFRVELENQGKKLLSRRGLEANALEVLLLTLPPDFLPEGESRITLYGEGPGRPEQELARFRIAVAP